MEARRGTGDAVGSRDRSASHPDPQAGRDATEIADDPKPSRPLDSSPERYRKGAVTATLFTLLLFALIVAAVLIF